MKNLIYLLISIITTIAAAHGMFYYQHNNLFFIYFFSWILCIILIAINLIELEDELERTEIQKEIPNTKILRKFLDELHKNGTIKEWRKVSGNKDEYIIKFNIK